MNAQEREQLVRLLKNYFNSLEIVETIDEIHNTPIITGNEVTAIVQKQYAKALRCVAEVEPAWDVLNLEEQGLLMEFYGRSKRHNGAEKRLKESMHVSCRTLYRLSSHALQGFADALAALKSANKSQPEKGMLEMDHSNSHEQETQATNDYLLPCNVPGENFVGFQSLANAVIVQAAKDYESSYGALLRSPENVNANDRLREIEDFFFSEWYEMLTCVNPKWLIKQLREKVETQVYGKKLAKPEKP